jgi:tRNA U55 pseudouridine synthase TruB
LKKTRVQWISFGKTKKITSSTCCHRLRRWLRGDDLLVVDPAPYDSEERNQSAQHGGHGGILNPIGKSPDSRQS